MFSTTSWAILTAMIAFSLNIVIPLTRNVRIARASGIPYVIVPYYSYNRATSIFMARTVMRFCLGYFGVGLQNIWLMVTMGNWPWKYRHRPFALLKTDTFLVVAPGGFVLNTADPDVTNQIISRPSDFTKAAHLYKPLNLYGPNVVAAEGSTWRYHRKLMSPVFSERNNVLVWKQSLKDGQAMLSTWTTTKGKAITTLARDTMLLSLSVIGHAGLGQTIDWPTASSDDHVELQLKGKGSLPDAHQMTFTVALSTLLRGIYYIVILPKWFLRNSPFKSVQRAYLAYLEWGQYLREVIASKREAMAQSDTTGPATSDLLSQLLKEHEQTPNTKSNKTVLSDSEITGNLFVMVIAGHETSANSIHFCLALLAMHPTIQREVQTDLDNIFQSRPSSQWNYEKDLPRLLNSKLNAVLNEQLRLFGPVITIPKYTHTPQPLHVNGKDVLVPAHTITRPCIPSLHRNPACWPTPPDTDPDTDLDTFRPSRWFTSTGSWQPPKGAYLPFSDGARACLGRRFAQVEILAVLALILSQYSIELAIDEEIHDGDGKGTSTRDRDQDREREAWFRARDAAKWTMRHKMVVIITLQIAKGNCVPVTVVKRGEERFTDIA